MQVETKNFAYTYKQHFIECTNQIIKNNTQQWLNFVLKTDQLIDFATSYLELQIEVNENDLASDNYPHIIHDPGQYLFQQNIYEGLALDNGSTSLIQQLKIKSNEKIIENIERYNYVGYIIQQLEIGSALSKFSQPQMGIYQQQKSSPQQIQQNQITGNFSKLTTNDYIVINAEGAPVYNKVAGFYSPGMCVQFVPYPSVLQTKLLQSGALAKMSYADDTFTYMTGLFQDGQLNFSKGISSTNWSYKWLEGFNPVMSLSIALTSIGLAPALKTNTAYQHYVFNGYGGAVADGIFNYATQSGFALSQIPFNPGVQSPLYDQYQATNLQSVQDYGASSGKSLHVNGHTDSSAATQTEVMRNSFATHCGTNIHNNQQFLRDFYDDVILPNYATQFLDKGFIQIIPKKENVKTYRIPILSSVVGAMATGHKGLVDGRMLGTLKFDFLTNPYAFYTTGQMISNEQFDDDYVYGLERQTAVKFLDNIQTDGLKFRKWNIRRARMYFDTYNPEFTPIQAIGPTEFWSNQWACVSVFERSKHSLPSKYLFDLSFNFKSLRMLIGIFFSRAYLTESCVRQLTQMNGAVQEFQIRMGNHLVPYQPIKGYADIPFKNYGQIQDQLNTQSQQIRETPLDNQQFVDHANMCLGSFMQFQKKEYCNQINFSLNQLLFESQALKQVNNAYIKDAQGNMRMNFLDMKLTHGGAYFFNKYQSKAIYPIRFDNLDGLYSKFMQDLEDYDFGFNGINTTDIRPMQLYMKLRDFSTINIKDKPVYENDLFIMAYLDVKVKFTEQGIVLEGNYLK